jgi:hypothetical protein
MSPLPTAGVTEPTPKPSIGAPTGEPTPKPSSPPGLPLKFELSADYETPQSMGYYPWSFLAEPFRDTTLSPVHRVKDAKYAWTVTLPAAGSVKESEVLYDAHYAHTLTMVFTHAGHFYNVKLDEWSASHGHRYEKAAVICKVRRRPCRKAPRPVVTSEPRVRSSSGIASRAVRQWVALG